MTATADQPLPLSSEAAFCRELVEFLGDIIISIQTLKQEIPAFQQATDAVDLEGRCLRLKAHFERLGASPSVVMFQQDFDMFEVLLQKLNAFLTPITEAKVARAVTPQSWERHFALSSSTSSDSSKGSSGGRDGKYTKSLARLNNLLNDTIADHILNLSVNIPEKEVNEDKKWPPTIEYMRLSKPSNKAEIVEEETREKQEALKMNFTAQTRRIIEQAQMDVMDDSAMSASCRRRLDDGDDSEYDPGMDASSTSILRCGNPRLHWDFSPMEFKPSAGVFGSSSNFSKSRKHRIELYIKTQVLREMPQDTQVMELRVVLSQLEPGDTSPGIMAGKAAMMSIGTLGALLVAPLIDLGGVSAKEAVSQAPLEAAAVFSHYLMEFELEDGTIGTLERCNEDVYLYAGRSSRPQQHTVSRIPMIPGCMGSPDSLDEPLFLRDLIRFRNEERQDKYSLLSNNCKHFVQKALSSGQLFPRANNLDEESLDAFFAVCQGCYVQGDQFSLFCDYVEEEDFSLFSDHAMEVIGGFLMDDQSKSENTASHNRVAATLMEESSGNRVVSANLPVTAL